MFFKLTFAERSEFGVRWYLAYALSYRDVEELMCERGYPVDHNTVNRWVIDYSPQLETAFQKKKKRVGTRRQCKYLNNIIEQAHRFIKRITRPMLGFKNLACAQAALARIELVRMLKKRQIKRIAGDYTSPADLFYALAR